MILIAMLCLSAEELNHKETIIFDIAETFSFTPKRKKNIRNTMEDAMHIR